jgi:hypothetical protein
MARLLSLLMSSGTLLLLVAALAAGHAVEISAQGEADNR